MTTHSCPTTKYPRADTATTTRMGRTLRSMRRELGLTQAETARRAGMSRESVSMIERGRSTQSGTLLNLLHVLGYHLAFLPYTPEEEALVERDQMRHRINPT